MEFKWMHDGKEVHSHQKYKITNGETNSYFSIGKIQAFDIGNYTCKAINAYGQDSKTDSVIIEGEINFDSVKIPFCNL